MCWCIIETVTYIHTFDLTHFLLLKSLSLSLSLSLCVPIFHWIFFFICCCCCCCCCLHSGADPNFALDLQMSPLQKAVNLPFERDMVMYLPSLLYACLFVFISFFLIFDSFLLLSFFFFVYFSYRMHMNSYWK
jgi:hypothetical protein